MSKFMKAAIVQAKKAYALGEVPIGCVIVKDNQIIARGYNRRSIDHNTLAHAEMIAIKKACKKLGDWRLEDCTMYITLEPCPMCAGAIVQARIKNIVIGAMNAKAGCAGSILGTSSVSITKWTPFYSMEKSTKNVSNCSKTFLENFDKRN